MMKEFKLNLPERSIWFLIICAGIILIIGLLGIFPLYRSNVNGTNEVKKLKYQIEEQKGLGPIYLAMLKTIENKDIRVLPNPKKTAIPRKEARKFQDTFRKIAERSGLMTASLTPNLSTLTNSSKLLLHNAVMKGEFANFRKMLIGLGAVSYMDRIEEIRIQQHSDSMEFSMKIWINVS
jgi:hypothetical protein